MLRKFVGLWGRIPQSLFPFVTKDHLNGSENGGKM